MPKVRADCIRQEVLGLQATAINIQRKHMRQAIRLPRHGKGIAPYKLLKKHESVIMPEAS